jgi:lipopolysaccharide/colanic/teichoic acid biosynthesis glycosyltransferase
LVSRYASVERLGFRGRLRLGFKRTAWVGVVSGTRGLKRVIDITGSIVLLILLLPFLAWVGLMIKLGSPGPVFFKQTRIGKCAAPFCMYKFRSMYVDAEARISAGRE